MASARVVFLAVWLGAAGAAWTGAMPGLAPDQRPPVAIAALAMAGWNLFGLVRARRRSAPEASLRERIEARRESSGRRPDRGS